MTVPTLVVSDPPHGAVDLDAAAGVLGLDVFSARVKSVFPAPEVMEVSTPEGAEEWAAALRSTGFDVAVVPGHALLEVPWPDPVESLVLDTSHLEATVRGKRVRISYDVGVFGVSCRPPTDRSLPSPASLRRVVAGASSAGIVDAIAHRSIVDLFVREEGTLRRVTIVPDVLELDGQRVLKDLTARLRQLRLDRRLEGVKPRAPFAADGPIHAGPQRRRYSFGTLLLQEALERIEPGLGSVSQLELGSRLAYALNPL
jgi:hypothetical protein